MFAYFGFFWVFFLPVFCRFLGRGFLPVFSWVFFLGLFAGLILRFNFGSVLPVQSALEAISLAVMGIAGKAGVFLGEGVSVFAVGLALVDGSGRRAQCVVLFVGPWGYVVGVHARSGIAVVVRFQAFGDRPFEAGVGFSMYQDGFAGYRHEGIAGVRFGPLPHPTRAGERPSLLGHFAQEPV
jgi:hypothetical protein